MINWSDEDWQCCHYFDMVKASIESDCFLDPDDDRPLMMQAGVNITERVDLILFDADIEESENRQLRQSAISALSSLASRHPNDFLKHIELSIGVFSYSGLLDISKPDVSSFWNSFFTKSQVSDWGLALQSALKHDTKLTDKLIDYVTLRAKGMAYNERLFEIKRNHKRLGMLKLLPPDYYLNRIIHERY